MAANALAASIGLVGNELTFFTSAIAYSCLVVWDDLIESPAQFYAKLKQESLRYCI